MNLQELLTERQAAIAQGWLDRVLQTYPEQTRRFLGAESDPFANPVGQALRKGITGLTDGLVRGARPDELAPVLEEVVKIRAVQGGNTSCAMGFIFLVKPAVRAELEGIVAPADLWAFDEQIDDLALLAFSIYLQCREKLYEIRVGEVQNRVGRLLKKAGMMAPDDDDEPVLPQNHCSGCNPK
ncbi:MAG TPA: RsbRD N-terminal domain-containing protein [Symbiobacteriaceae bacterium]